MDISLENVMAESNSLSIDEAVKSLWEWRKYRNQVFWSSMYRCGAVALILTLVPYLLPDLITKLGLAVFVFPILASFVCVFASYLMIVQYMLYKLVDRKYRVLLGSYNPGDIPDKPINRLFRISIGKILVGVFLCFGIIGQLLSGLVLLSLVRGTLP